jgi:hypothetical protein
MTEGAAGPPFPADADADASLKLAQKRIDCNKMDGLRSAPVGASEMSKPLGSPEAGTETPVRPSLQVAKKKGCKQHKCSKWKGGNCRCGRE